MTEEESRINDTWDDIFEPEPVPEPEEPAAPLEVISVDELLERLAGDREEEEESEEPEEAPVPEEILPETDGEEEAVPVQVVGMDLLLTRLTAIQGAVDHPALTTPFEDYTVTEGLLLLLLLSVFALTCVKLLKGGFAWLR